MFLQNALGLHGPMIIGVDLAGNLGWMHGEERR